MRYHAGVKMEQITDWAALWRQLVDAREQTPSKSSAARPARRDRWHRRAAQFDEFSKDQAERPSPIRDFLASRVTASSTVLDIGAGTGRWSVFLAPRVHEVTALEPSPAMFDILRRNVEAASLSNVVTVHGSWPEADVAPQDVSLCAHAVYGSRDLPAFVKRMIQVTRHICYLVLRMPAATGIMAEAATRLWGQPYDSPSFVVGYNVLLQMGLHPNVLIDPNSWKPWANSSLEEALADIKRRLGLGSSPSEHDAYLSDLLGRRLTYQDATYVWPERVHSALVYWDVGS